MTDYTKATGNGGVMLIQDNGTTVYFYVKAGSTSTWVNGLAVSWTVNGANGSGSINYPTGANWYLIKSTVVSSSQTVTFAIGASGTSGLGGPTSFSQYISRGTVPWQPFTAVDSISSSSARIVVTANNDGGYAIDAYEAYILTNNAWPTSGGNVVAAANGGTFSAYNLSRATTYYYTSRAHNSQGWGAFTDMKSFVTLSTVPDAPSAVSPISVTGTSVNATFAFSGSNGGAGIDLFRIHYGTDPNNPTASYIDTGTGNPNIIGGLANGTTYYFWAYAHNAIGWSAAGGRGQATTQRVPDAPNPVTLSANKQTSIYAVFVGGASDGGAGVDIWQISYGLDPVTPTNTWDSYFGTLTSLLPGRTYYFWARGHNAIGWSPYSARTSSRTIAGARVNVAGVWNEAVPYVRDAGVWKVAEGWAKIAGLWKVSG